MKPMTFRKEQMIQQQKVDIVTNLFRRLLHIQGGVTNMYMGNGILEISRIESGQTKLDEAVCNLEDIIKNR